MVDMPRDVAAQHEYNLGLYGNCVTKMTSEDGHHYMVSDGIAYRATDRRTHQPIDWSRLDEHNQQE